MTILLMFQILSARKILQMMDLLGLGSFRASDGKQTGNSCGPYTGSFVFLSSVVSSSRLLVSLFIMARNSCH